MFFLPTHPCTIVAAPSCQNASTFAARPAGPARAWTVCRGGGHCQSRDSDEAERCGHSLFAHYKDARLSLFIRRAYAPGGEGGRGDCGGWVKGVRASAGRDKRMRVSGSAGVAKENRRGAMNRVESVRERERERPPPPLGRWQDVRRLRGSWVGRWVGN